MAFIGNTPQNQSFAPAIDYFSGNGVTVTFTLSRSVASAAQVIVAIDNVIQNPSSAFTVSGNSITFTSAPLSGTNNIWVEYTSLITTYAAISQDPSVIGDITATGGFLAEGDFGNSYIDGTVVDYVTGNARITTGPIDNMTFYHGGTSGRSEMMRLSYAGNSYIVGNLGISTTSPQNTLEVYNGSNTQIRVRNGALNTQSYDFGRNGSTGLLNFYGNQTGFTGYVFGGVDGTRMTIDSSGNVLIGNSSSYAGKTQSWGAVTANAASPNFSAIDTTAVASGVGGELGFFGQFQSNEYAYLGSIRGIKENGTSGNTACALTFFTRPTGTAPTERMRITSTGQVNLTRPVGDDTQIDFLRMQGGGTSGGATDNLSFLSRYTASVSTSAKPIFGGPPRGSIVVVTGYTGASYFSDILNCSSNSVTVISSQNSTGSPASRTYSIVSFLLNLQMGSGTYDVGVLLLGTQPRY